MEERCEYGMEPPPEEEEISFEELLRRSEAQEHYQQGLDKAAAAGDVGRRDVGDDASKDFAVADVPGIVDGLARGREEDAVVGCSLVGLRGQVGEYAAVIGKSVSHGLQREVAEENAGAAGVPGIMSPGAGGLEREDGAPKHLLFGDGVVSEFGSAD